MFELYNDLLFNINFNDIEYFLKKILNKTYILKFIENKKQALLISCKKNYLSITKKLLKNPKVFLNIENNILQSSINSGNYKIIKLLIKYKYHCKNIQFNYHMCYHINKDGIEERRYGISLFDVMINGYFKIFKLLKNKFNIDVNNINNTDNIDDIDIIMIYEFISHSKLVKYMFKCGYKNHFCHHDIDGLLCYTIKINELATTKILIKNCPQLITFRNNIALFEAVYRGYYKIVKLMLKYNKSIDLTKNKIIQTSVNCRHKKITKILKKYKKEYNY
jgi:hypothetical protein